jgi:predicted Zn-dependent protease
VIGRAVLLVLALATAGWLASGYAGARDEQRAVYGDARTNRAEAIRLLDAARARRPDSTVTPRLAGLLVLEGRQREATAMLRPLLRAEPDNATGWAVLALALRETDPAAAQQALRRRLALVPQVRP